MENPGNEIGALVASGDVEGAQRRAEEWTALGRLREAIEAYRTIGEAVEAARGVAAGKLGDLHAAMGARSAAIDWYGRARAFGAPPDWVDARLRWLDESGAGDAFVSKGARDPGAWNQKGVVVIRPAYVAFVPTEARTHVAAIAAKALVAVAGVHVIEGRSVAARDVEPLLTNLSQGALDRIAPEMAQRAGGVVYDVRDARFRYEKLPLGVRLSFVTNEDRIMVLNAKLVVASPTFQRIVSFWPSDR